ncbi:uncharacterized protein LOC130691888 isoform X2 [Daphnia carinata]|uniref:uncharacterized protein LOC130691888 isoform X2 n=1 Tax=Daphnia carinata TaxID=120202 RepID=UPI0028692BF7|nr:uncharacterized protein LOC130691888 isoform X2 [Daphnia carinata]
MWREFLMKMRSKDALSENLYSDDDSEDTCDSDYSGLSGHYSFRNRLDNSEPSTMSQSRFARTRINGIRFSQSQCSSEATVSTATGAHEEESCVTWREKFQFTLSLIREPRYLLAETLVAEQLKLTLKQQAYRLEHILIRQTIQEHRQQSISAASEAASTYNHSGRRVDGDKAGADIESLKRQLLIVDQRLATLTGRLEVLKAVQQVLPAVPSGTEINSETDEPDSLEPVQEVTPSIQNVSGTIRQKKVGDKKKNTETSSNESDLLALLQLERLAQQASRRDYELLRKQYQRLKEELEWRDSGHGDDVGDAEFSSELISDRDRDSDSVQMKPSVALKSWTWRSSSTPSQESAATIRESHPGDNTSTCSSIESPSVANSENKHLWSEVQSKDKIITQLRSTIAELEPAVDKARAEATQRDMVNKELDRKNQELQMVINNLTANIEALRAYQLTEQHIHEKAFVSSDDNIQRKRTYKVTENKEFVQMRGLIAELQQKENEYKIRIEHLEKVLRHQSHSLPEVPNLEELERHVTHMEQELEDKNERLAAFEQYLETKEEEFSVMERDLENLREENIRLKSEVTEAIYRDRESNLEKLEQVGRELQQALEANKRLVEDINRERVLRKKYFNTIEDLKGKIRVYCRLRPLTSVEQRVQHSVADVIDPYTLVINTPKGPKEFHFDRVFLPEDTQETVFEDTHTLVQSAFDGYNVCICAYGQTGSGKTHTIIGDDIQPGLATRTFERIFQLTEDHQAQFDVQVSCSMLELYNDKLIDLLRLADQTEVKLEIKKDKRGIVWVQGSRISPVTNANQLSDLFQRGLNSRHTGSTRMNDRSSRSHLIVSINIECTSRLHGTVIRGKVSLLDLAGSERFAKSGSSGDQLREASSINKSLSTLGDVISALASEQQHTPYRNSKLTMLMQDSLGGNAKTLLFVTASIAAFNLDETLTSLTYASRAKAVTNQAQRSADCREIARLKAVNCSLTLVEGINKMTESGCNVRSYKNSGEGKKMSKIRVEKQHPKCLLGEFFVFFIL